MHRSSKDSGKRRSLFTRTPLSGLTPTSDSSGSGSSSITPNTLKKRRTSSQSTGELSWTHFADGNRDSHASDGGSRQTMSSRGSNARPTSIFGSLRSSRLLDESDEPSSATSVKSPMMGLIHPEPGIKWSRNVLFYGEVQTSSSMFRKKKEFLVLTDTHIVRTKSQHKASEMFSGYVSVALPCSYTEWLTDGSL
jgi:hypothetical protein